MRFYHAFWSRPQFREGVQPDPAGLALKDYEAITWLASILQARRLGSISLVTDTPGAAMVERMGLAPLYDGGVHTALDAVPRELLAWAFWCAGQLYALRVIKPPCMCLDTDAILWQRPDTSAPITALLQESKDWMYYRRQEEKYAPWGFPAPDWDWNVEPVNAGMVCYRDPELSLGYAELAIAFMESYSRAARANHCWYQDVRGYFDDAATFVDQRLLPMYAARCHRAIGLLGRLHPHAPHLLRNPVCSHLWFSKRWYDACPAARRVYCRFLSDYLRREHPASEALLERWRNDPKAYVAAEEGTVTAVPRGFELNFSLIEEVDGEISIKDANLDAVRYVDRNGMFFAAEEMRASPGASYRLRPCGEHSVRIKHVEEGIGLAAKP